MTSELQQSRYDQLIRRVGGIIGPGSKVFEALTELFPVLDVERVPGELLLLGQTQLCIGSITFSSAAAQSPRTQLFNPVDSGKLITVSSMIISVPAASIVRFSVGFTALTTGQGTERYRDGRLPLAARPSGQIRTQSSAAQTDAHGQFRMGGSDPRQFTDENAMAVLSPGSGYEWGSNIINNSISVTWHWRERVAEPSELNL